MLKNFLKVAFRNMARHKGFSFLNIAGLSFGLTACILIGLFVWDERQYDKNVPDGEQVYRIYAHRKTNEIEQNIAMVPPTFVPTLQQQFPEVDTGVRIFNIYATTLMEQGNKHIYQAGAVMAEPGLFALFPFQFVYGSSANALEDPRSVLLSEEVSQKLFGNVNPVGRELSVDKDVFQVKGVYRNDPKFHLQFSYILPLHGLIEEVGEERMQSWGWMQLHSYVKLKKGADAAQLEAKFRQIVKREGTAYEKGGEYNLTPHLQPLKEVHLYSSDFKYDIAKRGNATYVKALTIIAAFILLIACFNFVNLATAKSLQRAKEVGVRKTIGASRRQLMLQFIAETYLLVVISMLLSIILTFLLLPWLNAFTEKSIGYGLFTEPWVLLLLLLVTIIVGVLAGSYPAMVLSGFQPIKVLKSSAAASVQPGKVPWLRHSLVVVQFSISVLLIISAIVVYRQVNYLHNKDLGFNKEEIMFFPMRGENMNQNYESFKTQLENLSGVSSVSIGYGFPGDATAGDGIIVPRNGEQKEMPASQLLVDHDYVKTLGLTIVAGRDFSEKIVTDKDHAFLINETAVKEMGFGTPAEAIGKPLMWKVWNSIQPDSMKVGQVVGVVKDFHFKSLYDKLETTIIQIYPQAYWKVAVKFRTANAEQTIAGVQKVWNSFSPEYPIEYIFLDDNFEKMYQSEDKLRSLLWIFTGIAIFVGCLGLFGLAAYAAECRKKEIGIRKVLGASVQGVVALLSREFIRLVLIALVVASPLAWYFMNQWLQDFPYRISISWWVFAIAGVLAVLIALFTVSFQAIRAALANPVKSLRSE